MPIARLLSRERVECIGAPMDHAAVITRAAGLLARPAGDPGLPAAELVDRLAARERLASTGLGHGVAIPHCRLGNLDRPRAAFLRLAAPVDFDAPDGRPVDLVFAMAVPEQAVAGHLAHLAEIAERFSDEAFRAALRGAEDEQALAGLLLPEQAA
ncbi:MAG: PTS sugar transporter subunit IIA [Pseudomonadota bacterium]